MEYDIIVIGAGASGLMAAGRAAEAGARVLLLEKMPRAGIKLLISGKGRSNITNIEENIREFIQNYGKSGQFLYNVFSRFFNKQLMEFFKQKNVETVAERGGRVFPASGKAAEIVDALLKYVKENKVEILYKSPVEKILIENNRVIGVRARSGRIFDSKAVILATGGSSYPKTGSTGDGYKIAKYLGHTVIEIMPSLVPLETKQSWPKSLQGLSLENVKAAIYFDGNKDQEEFGDMLFTHFGISGPIILRLSRRVVELMGKGKVEISLDLKPALDKHKLQQRLIREFATKKIYKNILTELLPKKLINIFIFLSGVSKDKQGNQINKEERERIISLLKDLRMTISAYRPIDEAIVTRGGVSTKEIDPKTMESKKIKGLYLCGEVMDIDGQTGGYNLQAAFSTGFVAGESAANLS